MADEDIRIENGERHLLSHSLHRFFSNRVSCDLTKFFSRWCRIAGGDSASSFRNHISSTATLWEWHEHRDCLFPTGQDSTFPGSLYFIRSLSKCFRVGNINRDY